MRQLLFVTILNFFCGLIAAQNQNIPINYSISQKIERNINQSNGIGHSAVKPFVQSMIDSNSYLPIFADTNLYYYDFTQKLFKENLLNVHQKEVNLVCDPLFNLAAGKTFYNDTSLIIKTNTRGIRVAGDITSKFSFETRFYETQVFYPMYLDSISDSRNVAFGLGRDKPFKTNGHDVGMSSGYISYSPMNNLNIQFGQGKHFIGNGYRSLLLSDNAFNYPYLSFQLNLMKGKLMYKNINAWLQTIERMPVSSTPEALFKTKNGSFRYLSFRPNSKIEVGLFEGVVYKHYQDTLGEVAVHPSFYVPVIGVSSLANKNESSNKVVLGANLNISPIKSLLLYGQFVMDDFERTGYQAGVKWWDIADIKNSWLQVEYNKASPYLYTNSSENAIQNYAHVNQELAHPLGASFNELVVMAHFEKLRWFVTGKYFGAKKTRYGGSTYGENIFLPNNPLVILVAPEKINWSYVGAEAGYLFNVKTKMQFFVGSYLRSENQNNEWYWNIGFRTNLNNYYYEM